MASKVLLAVILLQTLNWVCSSKKHEDTSLSTFERNGILLGERTRVVKITHSTLDAQSSVVLGDDSDKVRGKVVSRFDSMYTTTSILSVDGLDYIVDFIIRNLKDSIKGNLNQGDYFLLINLYGTATKNLEFYLQPKTDNNFLARLIDTLKISRYKNEYTLLISKLTEYNMINKNLKY